MERRRRDRGEQKKANGWCKVVFSAESAEESKLQISLNKVPK